MELAGGQVLITGASRGIGLAIAERCAQEKAHLHLVARSIDSKVVEDLKRLGAPTVKIWDADLSSREGIDALVNNLGDQQIDVLINNAGQLTGGLLEEQPLSEIYSMFQVNLLATVHLTHALLPGMIRRGHGKIVNNASVSAVMHFPCATTYAAAKAGVLAFTNSLQLELTGTPVTALCLLTPGVKTRMYDEIDVKYGKNLNVPTDSIPAEEYAAQVIAAIKDDREVLEPSGKTGVGLFMARHFPKVFRRSALGYFKR
jgi:short-subunit dehydrogenase